MPDHRPMKVWTNRVPIDLVERWKARAKDEGADGAAMLRHTMETALASRRPIMPTEPAVARTDPAVCPHPRSARKPLGYTTRCGDCGKAV